MDLNRSCSPIYSHIHWTSLPVSVNGVSKTTARQIINNPLIIAPRMIEIRGLGEHENQQGVVGSSVRVTNPCDKRAPGFSWNSTGLSPVTTVRASSKPHPTHPTTPYHTPSHPTLPRSMVDRRAPPLCPSPPPYYCDLMSHGQHRTPPLTYIGLGLHVSARLEQQLQAWVLAIRCREVQGSVPFLGEEWRWGWGEGERGGGGWWSWTVGDQRICDDQRIVCSTDRMRSTDRMIEESV